MFFPISTSLVKRCEKKGVKGEFIFLGGGGGQGGGEGGDWETPNFSKYPYSGLHST